MQNYKKLVEWQKSHELVKAIYRATSKFPKEELFGLTSQIRRAAVSVPTNIVEGCGRGSNAELSRFLYISCGSAFEVEYLIFLCFELGYINQKQFETLDKEINDVKKMLFSLIDKIKK
jgi:four helix bundle protein